jgi:hypothetical protein
LLDFFEASNYINKRPTYKEVGGTHRHKGALTVAPKHHQTIHTMHANTPIAAKPAGKKLLNRKTEHR